LSAVYTAVAMAMSGSALAQDGVVVIPVDPGDTTPQLEYVDTYNPAAHMWVTVTFDDDLGQSNVHLGFDDGTPLSAASDLRDTEAQAAVDLRSTRSTSFRLGANNNSRYLYFEIGSVFGSQGIELWNDDLKPVTQRVLIDEAGQPGVGFTLSYKLFRPVDSLVGSFVDECTMSRDSLEIMWSAPADSAALELWYDGEVFATGLDASSGALALQGPAFPRKFNAMSSLLLVSVVHTEAGTRHFAVECGSQHYGYWMQLRSGACTANFATGWLTAHLPGSEPVDLFPSRTATEPVTSIAPAWSAAPSGVQRSDAAEFGSRYRLRLSDAFLDDAGPLTVRQGEQLGVRTAAGHIGCRVVLGNIAEDALAATRRAISKAVPLYRARPQLQEPAKTTHLLQFLRREIRGRTAQLGVNYVRGSSGFGIEAGAQPVLGLVETNGSWQITTESLCQRVASLLDANQFVPSSPCGESGAQPDSSLCMAYRLTAGMCQTAVDANTRPLLWAAHGLFSSDATSRVRGDFSEIADQWWSRPERLWVRTSSVTRHSADSATVVFLGLGGNTFELDAKRNRWGRWKFTVQSICESRYLSATRPGQLPMRPIIGGGGD
jgi:hypothetical protein